MKTKLMPMLVAALILPTLAACGGGSTSPNPSPDSTANGTWDGTEYFGPQHGTNAQNHNIRYVITDTSGVITGSVYYCKDNTFNCPAGGITGSRSGNSLTFSYYDADSVLIKTTGTFSGNTFNGTTQYTTDNGYTFNGTTTLVRK